MPKGTEDGDIFGSILAGIKAHSVFVNGSQAVKYWHSNERMITQISTYNWIANKHNYYGLKVNLS